MSKICFVTQECAGVAEAGGIGACVRGLSQAWADRGHEVDLLIADLSPGLESADLSSVVYARRVHFLRALAAPDGGEVLGDTPSRAYAIHRFLHARDYDEVHFHDFLGLGFYTAMARRMGLFAPRVVTHLHGPSRWVREYNLNPPDIAQLEQEALEASQIENSDEVVSPSLYLLDWCRARGMKLPEAKRRAWVLPPWPQGASPARGPLRTRALAGAEIDEIVFFGRQERRKGFKLFVDAVAALPPGAQPDITFLGRFDRVAGEHSGGYALRRLQDYPGRIRFLSDFKQSEALARLRRSRTTLTVMPSLIENSPCTVGECFTLGVPFLATDVGGVAELIDEASRPHCLTPPHAADLSRAIARVLREGLPELVSTLDPAAIMESWTPAPAPPRPAPPRETPLVSVCLTHHERPHLLRRALEALFRQTYERLEIIVVDDGSQSPAALAALDDCERASARFPVTVLRTPNRYLGAARNAAARAAKGDYLLFNDDDNFAEPHEVETFVRAAQHYGADILTAFYYTFREGEQHRGGPKRVTQLAPFGIGGVFSLFMNRFGDANALIRRDVFEEIGGFSEAHGVSFEDWEFFLKCHLAGKRIGVVPEPLFNYRTNPAGMLATGDAYVDYERIYALIDALRPSLGADLARVAYGPQLVELALGRTRQILAPLRGGDLLLRLTGCEPNSREALALLADLAMTFGRFTDAVELSARDPESARRIEVALQDPAVRRRMRGAFNLTVLEPSAERDFAFVAGWAMDGDGAPVDLTALWIDGALWRVVALRRERRPDVARAFGVSAEAEVGFRLYAQGPVEAEAEGEAAPAPTMAHGFRVGAFEAHLPDGPGWRGHVEAGEWGRAAVVALPAAPGETPIVEIETGAPAEAVLIWSDGAVDWGRAVSPSRRRFTREATGLAREVTALAPSSAHAHVTAS